MIQYFVQMVINVVLLIHQPIDNNYNDTSNDDDNNSNSSIGLIQLKKYISMHFITTVHLSKFHQFLSNISI